MTDIKKESIKLALNFINEAIKTKKSLNKLCVEKGRARNFVSDLIWYLKRSDVPDNKEDITIIHELLDVYDRYLKFKVSFKEETVNYPSIDCDNIIENDKFVASYDAYDDDNYDERSVGTEIRDGENITLSDGKTVVKKITAYYYNIKIKGKPDLTGYLERDEMDMIYRLYSNMDGAGLTQRSVSRHFPTLSFADFKRILRAFQITKSSHPVAPHIIEESSLDEAANIIYRNKENALFKKLDEDRGKQTEKILKEVQKELIETKNKLNDWRKMVSDIIIEDINPFNIVQKQIDTNRALIVYLSDMHVGAKTKEESIYDNKYDEIEFNDRLKRTCNEIINQYKIFGVFDKIIICNLGDSLDGYNAQTTRGGHSLPQNMDNREQFNVYYNGMCTFFETIHQLNISNSVDYMCVGDANHDGDFGYIANRAIEIWLNARFPQMNTEIYTKFIEHFNYGEHTFILTHGKDKEDKKFGLPLVLNDKTELYFEDYINNKSISNKYIHVISGDLHQTSINYGKRFRYKKVSSLYGSSKWIHTNFGNTKAGVDFEIVPKCDSVILEGRLTLN